MANLIIDLIFDPHPWWVWVIVGMFTIEIIAYWIKKPYYDN
jgi:hypothetical protein